VGKETYYFSHDYEPTSDPKIQALLGEYGGLGYGVYWRIVEMLHSDESHKLPLKQYVFLAIAKQMLTSAEQIQTIITFATTQCELFISDGEFVWSRRVNDNFLHRKEISEKRALAGRAGAIAKQNLAKHGKGKERKRKEKKEYIKEIYKENIKLTKQEVERLEKDYGKELTQKAIQYLSDYKIEKKYKTADDNLTLRRWVFDAVLKQNSNGSAPKPKQVYAQFIPCKQCGTSTYLPDLIDGICINCENQKQEGQV
jgi:hypothetical protein